ncbi:unnamed protein product [Schistocephalus solidus]|uniref:Reverse transcriptase domain-containing protein n=1 Tax=Schistocephalus solidus TaxID=70667 RepID=A0A183SXI2_SCHSO|nr:unnamed protein product [Schistocephalus solidus]
MTYATFQLQAKCQEMRIHLTTSFVDLKKSFDTLNSDRLSKIMQKFCGPERFMHMVRQLHDGMTARGTDNGPVSEAFAVTNGVKQGCILAPTLFSLMYSAMLMDAYRDERPGIRIAYRTDGHLLNNQRMQAPMRVSTPTVHDLLFADDCALNIVMEDDMKSSMNLFAEGCANHYSQNGCHAPAATQRGIQCSPNQVNGAQLKNVETFAYLGSTLFHALRGKLSIYAMLRSSLDPASATFQGTKLNGCVWIERT